jgi:hypothetical protein
MEIIFTLPPANRHTRPKGLGNPEAVLKARL